MANRTATIVIGAFVTAVGAILAAGGATVIVVLGSDGSVSTGQEPVNTTTTALVANVDDIDGTDGVSAVFGRPELRLTANSSKPVFIGVGPAAAVDAYFAGADIDVVDDFDLDPFRLNTHHRSGAGQLSPPGAQPFWVAKSSGTHAVVHWKIRNGDYRIVAMNADAAPAVSIEGRFTLAVPHLYGVGLAAFIVGLVGIALGVLLLVLGIRKPHKPAPGQPAVAYSATA